MTDKLILTDYKDTPLTAYAPDSDGDMMIEILPHQECDTAGVTLNREKQKQLRDWLNSSLGETPP